MKLNWRTALILAELELEIEALAQGRQHRQQLKVGEWVGGWGGWVTAGALLSMLTACPPACPPACFLACLPLLPAPQELLNKKDMVGDCFNQLRLARQRTLNDNAVVSAWDVCEHSYWLEVLYLCV